MRIFIAGPPRTGSMWTYNVTRALLESAGKTILPIERPGSPEEINSAIAAAYASEPAKNSVYCIKTHLYLPNDLPETKIITNYRDVRDSMISFVRFMKLDKGNDLFDLAIKTIISHMQETDFYFQQHKDNLRIKFNHITDDQFGTIRNINKYLELSVGEEQMRQINNKYSKEKVSNLIERLDSIPVSDQGLVQGKENSNAYDTVKNYDGSYRVRDRETYFQTNHITSKKDGEWAEYFTPQQRKDINSLVSVWLEKYNFQL